MKYGNLFSVYNIQFNFCERTRIKLLRFKTLTLGFNLFRLAPKFKMCLLKKNTQQPTKQNTQTPKKLQEKQGFILFGFHLDSVGLS